MVFHSLQPDLYIGAALAFVIFITLGITFARRPFVFVDDVGARASGKALPLAIFFTRSGYGRALTILAIAGTIFTAALHVNVVIPVLLIAAQLLGQLTANVMKRLVARLRPEVWHFRQEMGFAYPSGHAVTAIVFYIGWAAIVQRWPLPHATIEGLCIVLVLWALGVGWSRLALGAHRLTDVLGGYALGAAWLLLFVAAT